SLSSLCGQRVRDPAAQLGRTRSRDARTLRKIELGLTERARIVEQLERETALATEELRCGDIDGASLLERADPVDTAGCEMAERERERPHDAEPVREAGERGGTLRDERRQRRFEAEDLDLVLRSNRAQRPPVEPRSLAAA